MPGANLWAVLLFSTLVVLGSSSAFVMLYVVAIFLLDFGFVKLSRPYLVLTLALCSLRSCLALYTRLGY